MTAAAFIVVAGAASILRLALRLALAGRLPWGTLAVNLAGSFALGAVSGLAPPLSTVIATAGIGALTTFSTLADEVVAGWREDRTATATYLAISVVGGVAAAWTGLQLA